MQNTLNSGPPVFWSVKYTFRSGLLLSAIFTWNYLRDFHRDTLFHKLATKCLKKLLRLHFLRKYVWHDFSHNISSSTIVASKITCICSIKMAWNFVFAFLSGASGGFGGDGIGLHEAFLVVPRMRVRMKIFIWIFGLVGHWSRRPITNIN